VEYFIVWIAHIFQLLVKIYIIPKSLRFGILWKIFENCQLKTLLPKLGNSPNRKVYLIWDPKSGVILLASYFHPTGVKNGSFTVKIHFFQKKIYRHINAQGAKYTKNGYFPIFGQK